MKSNNVYITDYIQNPDIEKNVLKDNLSSSLHKDIEVLLVWHENINKDYIDKQPALKGVIRYGVGYDNIDIKYAESKGILCCNTPDYGTEEVSDTVIAMIMNIIRGVTRYDYLCRNLKNTWQENTINSIKRTSDIILGVIGAGRIGGSIILRAHDLRIKTMFYDPYKPRGYEKLLGSQRVDELDILLTQSDIISINTPLTDETKNMVDENFVASMKKGSSLINTARGKIVKHIDIFYKPLRENHLLCVNLDVMPDEPPSDTSKLIDAWRKRTEWLDGRLIINPHVAYFSKNAYIEMRQKAAENAKRILENKKPFNILNTDM